MLARILICAGALAFAGLNIGAGCGMGDGGKRKQAREADEGAAPGSSAPSGPAEIDYRMKSCDTGGKDQLVGSVDVQNVGGEDARATATFRWQLDDGSWLDAPPKQLNVVPGQSELVFFSYDATIDEQLAFQGHPGYFKSNNCQAKVTLDG